MHIQDERIVQPYINCIKKNAGGMALLEKLGVFAKDEEKVDDINRYFVICHTEFLYLYYSL